MVALVEIWSINRLAILGVQITKMEQNQADLSLQNQILQTEIAQKSSLTNVETEAKELGFQDIKKLTYIQGLPLASK